MSELTGGTFAASIWDRVIGADRHALSPDETRALLRWKFPDSDRQRVDQLSEKARAGNLSAAEQHVNEPVPLNQEFSNIRLLQLGNYAATLTEYRQRLCSIQCTLQQVLRCSQRILPDVANGLVKCEITLLCPDYFFVSTSHFRRSASATS